jgi:hypothetical protein
MQLLNRGASNTLVGIFLLVLLAVFAGPNVLPRLISSFTPFDEAVPCAWLRVAEDRANHQSLIGRATEDPLQLELRAGPVPTAPDNDLVVNIVIINASLGTVPIVYDPDEVIIGDNGSSGLGLIFAPPYSRPGGPVRQDPPTFSENSIRLLGPRQRCVHSVIIPYSQLDNAIRSGQSQVRAYYRITTAGPITTAGGIATPIYPDQGLDIVPGGIVESPTLPLALVATGPA